MKRCSGAGFSDGMPSEAAAGRGRESSPSFEKEGDDKSSQSKSIDSSLHVDDGAAHIAAGVQLLDLVCQIGKADRFTDVVK